MVLTLLGSIRKIRHPNDSASACLPFDRITPALVASATVRYCCVLGKFINNTRTRSTLAWTIIPFRSNLSCQLAQPTSLLPPKKTPMKQKYQLDPLTTTFLNF